jgi:hypothetical protein
MRVPWWWRQYAPPKRRFTSITLHGSISQKAVIFITMKHLRILSQHQHTHNEPKVSTPAFTWVGQLRKATLHRKVLYQHSAWETGKNHDWCKGAPADTQTEGTGKKAVLTILTYWDACVQMQQRSYLLHRSLACSVEASCVWLGILSFLSTRGRLDTRRVWF